MKKKNTLSKSFIIKLQDISLVRADSLDSLSSGGDSDGGPAEPTAAEISLLSASIGM